MPAARCMPDPPQQAESAHARRQGLDCYRVASEDVVAADQMLPNGCPGRGQVGLRMHRHRARTDVAAGDQESERAAVFVRQGVNFGGSTATGTADRLIFLPPFPPAAER